MKNINEKILIALLANLWLLPFCLAPILDRKTDFAKTENRNRAQWPKEFCYRLFPGEVEAYYNDRVPFRALLLKGVRYVNYRLIVANERRVIAGKDSFLFFQIPGSGECPFRQYIDDPACRLRDYDIRRICRHVSRAYTESKRRNADFLFLIAPSKINVYPDKLPNKRDFPRSTNTLMDRVCATLASEMPQIPVLNLEPDMIQYRRECPVLLYFPQDTHWNFCGAYFAMKSILAKLNSPWPASWPWPDQTLQIQYGSKCMLGLLTMMQNPPPPHGDDPFPKDFPPYTFGKNFQHGDYTLEKVFHSHNPAAPDPRTVVVFRDSFTVALQPFLSSYFREVYCYWQNFSPDIVEVNKPDLVILECVSRALVFLR